MYTWAAKLQQIISLRRTHANCEQKNNLSSHQLRSEKISEKMSEKTQLKIYDINTLSKLLRRGQ